MLDPNDAIRLALTTLGAPPEPVAELISRGHRTLLEKGMALCRLGETEHRLAFIHSGIMRYHVIVPESGDDVTKDFSFAGTFAVSYGSAVQRLPARVAVSAVEDCVVTLWPYQTFADLFERNAEWAQVGRRIAEWLYVRKENRELAFLLQNASERYEAALTEFPTADLQRVPQHLLASYLGVTPESLSRLKRSRRER